MIFDKYKLLRVYNSSLRSEFTLSPRVYLNSRVWQSWYYNSLLIFKAYKTYLKLKHKVRIKTDNRETILIPVWAPACK